jgi:hypothetical protein
MLPSWLSDARAIEQRLAPCEATIEQIHSLLFWRNPLALAAVVTAINTLFCLILFLDLSFVPAFFLLLSAKVLFDSEFGWGGPFHPHLAGLFQPEPPPGSEVYPAYGVADVAAVLAQCGRLCGLAADRLFPREPPTLKSLAMVIGVLLGLLLLFAWLGTFWVAFILANGLLLLPGVLFHPVVFKRLQKLAKSRRK